ncbi:MAG: CvpA family protein [Lachnospiraceae bacterium]|nr:CvpA family protein [Lachnospiraceae bacterium]
MNILLIALAIIMVWRIAAGMKKGIVREALSLVSVLFVVLIIGIVSMITGAYHESNYIAIAVMLVVIVVLSIAYSIIKIVFFPAKVLTKLPVLSSMDKFCGMILGVAETLVGFWGMCYAIMNIEFGTLNQQIFIMIGESSLLTALYQYNLLGVLLETLKEKIVF